MKTLPVESFFVKNICTLLYTYRHNGTKYENHKCGSISKSSWYEHELMFTDHVNSISVITRDNEL